jgi:UDP-N-acetylglucosamine 2-epimerase (non-hydrolysing)
MIDSFEMLRARIAAAGTRERLGLNTRAYTVVTLHRPSNVDRRDKLAELVVALAAVAQEVDVVFAIHPRTRKKLEDFGLLQMVTSNARIRATDPLSYIEFMNLVMHSTIAITDSGGVQEETTYLGIPCVTLRDNTERPITVTEGTNRLLRPAGLLAAVREALSGKWPQGRRPDLWDGHAAARAALSLERFLTHR